MKCLLLLCLCSALAWTEVTSAGVRSRYTRQTLDELGNVIPDPIIPGLEGSVPPDHDECQCVEQTRCSSGAEVMDIRSNFECDYLEVCCGKGDILPAADYSIPDVGQDAPPPVTSTTDASTDDIPPAVDPILPEPGQDPPAVAVPTTTDTSADSLDRNKLSPTVPEKGMPPCGVRNVEGISGISQDYVRNVKLSKEFAEFAEFPWMVAVLNLVEENGVSTPKYVCGGSLIHPQAVLTAAHCVHGKSQLMIRAGEYDAKKSTEPLPHQNRTVRRVILHEQFRRSALQNDVALLILDTPVVTAPHVGFLCLPEQDENMDNRDCVASGWGKDQFGDEGQWTVVLKKVELPTVPRESCVTSLRGTPLGHWFRLHDSFICAGGQEGKDTCKGDGGSPLACPSAEDPNKYVQAGIVAWGVGCGNTIPGVYVGVAQFRRWIDNQLLVENLI